MKCSVSLCNKPSYCRGLCKYHYESYRENGTIKTNTQITPIGMLLLKVQRTPSGCLVVDGKTDSNGYVETSSTYTGKKIRNRAHRVAYESAYGPIPKGLFICHHCDTRNCVNPSHLFLGTCADNNSDMKRKKRHEFGEQHHFARLTEQQVKSIRESADSADDIAKCFNISIRHAYKIKSKDTWTHIK